MSETDDTLRVDCPHCKCPGQWVNLACGMCGKWVIPTAANVDKYGAAKVEEVIGYRSFRIERERGADVRALAPGYDFGDRGVPILHSPVVAYRWDPLTEWHLAECQGSGNPEWVDDPEFQHRNDQTDPDRIIPSQECNGGGHGCGFYAGRTHAHLIDIGYASYGCMARIQMAGKLIPHTNGFRAQKVKILDLYVPFEEWQLANDLKAVYGPLVNVELGQTAILQSETAIEWCPRCKAKMPKRSPTCTLCGYTHK